MTLLAGRWEKHNLLKEGLGICTWRGTDRETNTEVIIREAPLDTGLFLRLAHEAELLGQLQQKGIPRLLHLGRYEQIVLVAEYLEGETLEQRLARGPLPWEKAAELMLSLLEILQHVHDLGVLHRDLKPSNLVCRQDGLALIDWGLSRWSRLQGPLRDQPVGSLGYLAPEMSGSLRADIRPRADLYATGVTFSECLLGRRLFEADTVSELFRLQLNGSPPIFPGDLPAAIQAFIHRLIVPDPTLRFQSAHTARETLARILNGQSEPPEVAEAPGQLDPPFLGRETEVEHLEQSSKIWLTAPPGQGKTALLDEVCRRAAARGEIVLRGQAWRHSNSIPLQLLSGVFFTLAQTVPASLLNFPAEESSVLGRLSPDLRPLLPDPANELGTEEQGPQRALLALHSFVHHLADLGRPVLLALDDAQWADDLSRSFLRQLSRNELPPGIRLVAASRPEADLAPLPRLDLGPLKTETSLALVEAMAPGWSNEDRVALLEFSKGSPFWLLEGVRGRLRNGQPLHVTTLAAETLHGELWNLLPGDQQLLKAAAVLGRSFPTSVLERALGLSVLPGLRRAHQQRLLWESPSATEYGFVHDLLRDKVLAQIGPAELSDLHLACARALEIETPEACQDLAYHYRACGQLALALPYTLRAAAEARAAYDFRGAAEHLSVAVEVKTEDPDLWEALADMQAGSGVRKEATRSYLVALRLLSHRERRRRILLKLGQMANEEGNYDEALDFARQAVADQPALWEALLKNAPASDGLLAARALLLDIHFMKGQLTLGVSQALRLTSLALRSGQSADSLYCRAELLALASLVVPATPALLGRQVARFEPEAQSASDNLVNQAGGLADPVAAARIISRARVPAVLYLPLRKWSRDFDFCAGIFRQAGNLWELGLARIVPGLFRRATGHFREVAEQGAALYHTAHVLEHDAVRFLAFALWALGTQGRIPARTLEWALATEASGMVEHYRRLGIGLAWMGQGRHREAGEMFGKPSSAAPIDRAYSLNLATTCWRRAAEETPDPWERQQLLRKARRTNRASQGYRYPLTLCQSLREAALLAAERGHFARCQTLLGQSLEISDSLEYTYESALTRWEQEHISAMRGRPHQVEQAMERLLALGAVWHAAPTLPAEVPQLALIDRFDQALHWAHQLVRASPAKEVHERLRQAALALFRCQEAIVLSVPDFERLAGPPWPWSRRTVSRALEARRPVVWDDSSGLESLILTRSRSVLAAPVQESGQLCAVLYLVHASVGTFFGPQEEQLAVFLTSLAGASLESLSHQSRFQDLFEVSGVALARLAADGTILDHNPALGGLLGHPKLDGRPLTEFIAPESHGALQSPETCEVQLASKGGLWAQLSRAPLGADTVVSLADVTDRRVEQVVRFQREERRLLSEELQASLSGPITHLSHLLQTAKPGESLESCRTVSARLLADISHLIYDLRNPVAEGHDFSEGLRRYLTWYRSHGDFELSGIIPETAKVSGLTGVFAYRIIQEALINVRRHALPRKVHVEVQTRQNLLRCVIEDDGRGFSPESLEVRESSGLLAMRMRAELLGGRLDLDSRPGAGTRIRFELPRTW